MKYQQIIMVRRIGPQDSEFRQFYVPVEDRDGRWMPCGELRQEHVSQQSMLGSVGEYEHGGGDTCGPLDDIPHIDGWSPVSRLWLPDDYVPPSAEVLEEGERRARKYLKEMLGDD
jgi:hypothetical protein